MSQCTNPKVGILLHGYELHALTDPETEQFELHMLECEKCFHELNSFEQEAAVLAGDTEVRDLMDAACPEQPEAKSSLAALWRYLWPNVPVIFKPAIGYLLALLMIIPAYQGFKKPIQPGFREGAETVYLTALRSIEERTFSKQSSKEVNLQFYLEDYAPDRRYQIIVRFEDSSIVYDNSDFHGYQRDGQGYGTLQTQALSRMKAGKYRLSISWRRSDSSIQTREYPFRIED